MNPADTDAEDRLALVAPLPDEQIGGPMHTRTSDDEQTNYVKNADVNTSIAGGKIKLSIVKVLDGICAKSFQGQLKHKSGKLPLTCVGSVTMLH